MQTLTFMELSKNDFSIMNISALKLTWRDGDIDNYTSRGRIKNIFYYMINGHREYIVNGELVLHLRDADIIFIPNGYHYYSKVVMDSTDEGSTGIGITFDLYDRNGEELYIDEPLKIVADDRDKSHLELFERILESIMWPNTERLRAKASLYSFFDAITSDVQKEAFIKKQFADISLAIEQIEKYPEENMSIKELANLCCVSESSFHRKFKQYSNGIPPLAYRNQLRVMKAKEMCTSTTCSIERAAQILGFCDAAHLCRTYKQYTGKTLKLAKQ